MKKLIVANWKMNPPTLKEAERLFFATTNAIGASKNAEVVICPPFVYMTRHAVQGTRYKLGAQDVFWEDNGAFTGEVSPRMVKSAGASYVILGHSERRAFGETDEVINKKVNAALTAGLHIILCVGERERVGNLHYALFIKGEVKKGLGGVPRQFLKRVTVAYEPLWAISPGTPDTPESMLEMAIYIRRVLFDTFGKRASSDVRMLYGGSVAPENAHAFLENGGVDGLLVGRASLDAKAFGEIVKIASRISHS